MRRATLLIGVITSTLALLATPAPVRGATSGRAPLMFTEILTGAASASDEYVQIEATGEGNTSISDLELIYRSASGLTARRLVSLAALPPLAAGGRLLLANAAGSAAGQALLTWSDGIASSGGALLLRKISTPSEIIDAVAWGNAALAAGGEGAPVAAPASGVVIQRRRDLSGAPVDGGDNSSDFTLYSGPPPTPTPTPTPTSAPTAAPTATPAPSPTPLSVSSAREAAIGTRLYVSGVVVATQGELAEAELLALQDPVSGAGIFVLAPLMSGSEATDADARRIKRATCGWNRHSTAAPDGSAPSGRGVGLGGVGGAASEGERHDCGESAVPRGRRGQPAPSTFEWRRTPPWAY